jgi:hypothetical protein
MRWFVGIFKCKVCEARVEQIADLKKEIERLVKEKENERAEYKRAIDVLLHEKQLPVVGQGVYNHPAPVDPMAALAFMEEAAPEKK